MVVCWTCKWLLEIRWLPINRYLGFRKLIIHYNYSETFQNINGSKINFAFKNNSLDLKNIFASVTSMDKSSF